MIVSPPILAQPLAPDNVWFALLLLAALAWIRRLDALKSHVAAHRHTRHHRTRSAIGSTSGWHTGTTESTGPRVKSRFLSLIKERGGCFLPAFIHPDWKQPKSPMGVQRAKCLCSRRFRFRRCVRPGRGQSRPRRLLMGVS